MIGNKDKGHRSCIQILPNRKESQPMPINEQSSEKKYYSNSFDKIIYDENCCCGIWAVFMLFKIELTPFNDWRKILLLEVVVLHFCSKMNRFFSNCAIHLKKQQNIVMVCSNVDRIFVYMHMPLTTIK